jgi:hypothetical protein
MTPRGIWVGNWRYVDIWAVTGGAWGRVNTEPKGFSVAAVWGGQDGTSWGRGTIVSIVNNNSLRGSKPARPASARPATWTTEDRNSADVAGGPGNDNSKTKFDCAANTRGTFARTLERRFAAHDQARMHGSRAGGY